MQLNHQHKIGEATKEFPTCKGDTRPYDHALADLRNCNWGRKPRLCIHFTAVGGWICCGYPRGNSAVWRRCIFPALTQQSDRDYGRSLSPCSNSLLIETEQQKPTSFAAPQSINIFTTALECMRMHSQSRHGRLGMVHCRIAGHTLILSSQN